MMAKTVGAEEFVDHLGVLAKAVLFFTIKLHVIQILIFVNYTLL